MRRHEEINNVAGRIWTEDEFRRIIFRIEDVPRGLVPPYMRHHWDRKAAKR